PKPPNRHNFAISCPNRALFVAISSFRPLDHCPSLLLHFKPLIFELSVQNPQIRQFFTLVTNLCVLGSFLRF
ncbi:hypothetical protein LINGRAHAP2_LOCUS34828, partial [Linum grandiflorum]